MILWNKIRNAYSAFTGYNQAGGMSYPVTTTTPQDHSDSLINAKTIAAIAIVGFITFKLMKK